MKKENLDRIPLLVGVAKGESRKPGLETLILGGSHQLISLPATSPALESNTISSFRPPASLQLLALELNSASACQ